ncbi:MAG: nuclear transport factor 2 family protein [Bacteroidales bacterium]|nr:nuclear transport factor 2 family protein [Bacteroidales bacterium]
MKKCLALGFLLVSLAACDSEKSRIEQSAYKYSIAVANYDIDGAEDYCTVETSNTFLKTARYLLQFVDSSYMASDTPATIEIVSVNQLSDTTAAVVFHKQTPIKDFSDTLRMRKRDGKWLAHSPIEKNHTIAQ